MPAQDLSRVTDRPQKCNVGACTFVYLGATNMLTSLIDMLFGCSHSRTTFPITPKRPSARVGAYVTCLDCGKEFAYNWSDMRREDDPIAGPAVPLENAIVRPAHSLSRLLRLGS